MEHEIIDSRRVAMTPAATAAEEATRAARATARQLAALDADLAAVKSSYQYNGIRFDLHAKDEHYETRHRIIASGAMDAYFPLSLVGENGTLELANRTEAAAVWADMLAHIAAAELHHSRQTKALRAAQ